jgi:spore maturation protein CgeB
LRWAFFYHSVRSDWNHGNAHFLRGLVRSLAEMGHESVCYEAAGNWSVSNLVATQGLRPLLDFRRRFSFVDVRLYQPQGLALLERKLCSELDGVDVVVLHEWTAIEHPALLELLLRLRRRCGFRLLFHDTHYRVLTQPVRMARLGLERCDAVLAYSPSIADAYRERLHLDPRSVHVVHEAADPLLFRPLAHDQSRPLDDALFVGNWGGDDRAAEFRAFFLRAARRHKDDRRFALYGVRYPEEMLRIVANYYGVDYRGWLPNYRVPEAFAQAHVVLHVPRRQYVRMLYGTPTIRVFEALACGATLLSTPWPDTDRLFCAGEDYVVAETPAQQEAALQWLWKDETARARLGRNGRRRIMDGHTCLHRAEQIIRIVARLQGLQPPSKRIEAREPLPAGAAVVAGD